MSQESHLYSDCIRGKCNNKEEKGNGKKKENVECWKCNRKIFPFNDGNW